MFSPSLHLLCLLALASTAGADDAQFHRAISLNGPRATIDGRPWDAKDAPGVEVLRGERFENHRVTLKPPTDPARAQMIRSSVWGKDRVEISIANVPAGAHQIFVTVWEDNHSERFDILINGVPVLEGFHSGSAGMWKRLGPFACESRESRILVGARGGAANLSGVEIWTGSGPIPSSEPASATAPTPELLAFFESKVRPILVENCYECHSADAKKIKGGLLLDSRAGVAKGGDTGPAVTPGDPEASLLIEAVRHGDKDTAMPPKQKLAPEQIAVLEEWVRMRVPDPREGNTPAVVEKKAEIDWVAARQWWSLKPVVSPPLPAVRDAAWPVNGVDHFILARLEAADLSPAPDADRRTLIRRATFDLIGLPPTPEEVAAFVADPSPDAFATVVERLLASPQYGERWGRQWLDVVRYADTAGDNSDFPIPQMHLYRDWVIAAINRDMPYDEFVRAQIAGDLLGGATEKEKYERIVATGYLANARRFGSRVEDYPQHLTIEDTLDNFGRAFLGLSVNCARCHDHKFDPITAQDYYALYGIFHSTRYPWPGIEMEQKQRDMVPLAPENEVAAWHKEQEARQAPLDAEVKRLEAETREAKDEAKKTLEEELKKARDIAHANKVAAPPFPLAYATAEGTKSENVAVHLKGDPARPGPVVPRHFLTVLGGAALPPEEQGSGRRQLAEWVLDSSNPLPARVMVNRIWLGHFSKGLVPTPNDFGKQGKPPTHPELLDWLAAKFREEGWSLKKVHRVLMLSRTYRQAGTRSEAAVAIDPGNDLLAGYPRRRLDAETLRDTVLTLGGSLDLSPGTAHPFPPAKDWKFTQHNPFKAVYETSKRSVYLMTQRIQRHPFLAIFDGADPSVSTPARPTSTTPLQALYLLNDPLIHDQSRRFADRLRAAEGEDAARLQLGYEMAFARPATDAEVADALQFLQSVRERLADNSQAWEAMVRVLFRLNEFVYLD